MKKNFIFVSLILVFCLSLAMFNFNKPNTSNVFAEDYENFTKILVCGKGCVCVKPDIATIKLAINSIGEDVNIIKEENLKNVNILIEKAKELNILEENIKTLNYSLFNRYDYSNKEQVFLGYEISSELEIKTKDIESLPKILSGLMESGVTEIHSVKLSVEDYNTNYNKALANALENAKVKVQSLTNSSNLKLIKIKEECLGLNSASSFYDAKTLENETNFSQILKNEICIKANIVVEFLSNNIAVQNKEENVLSENTLDNTISKEEPIKEPIIENKQNNLENESTNTEINNEKESLN